MGNVINLNVALRYLKSPVWTSVDHTWHPNFKFWVRCVNTVFEANSNYQVLYGVDLLKLDFNIC